MHWVKTLLIMTGFSEICGVAWLWVTLLHVVLSSLQSASPCTYLWWSQGPGRNKKAQLFKVLGILGLEITSSHLFAKISRSPVQMWGNAISWWKELLGQIMKDVDKDKYGKLDPFIQSIYHTGRQKFSKFFLMSMLYCVRQKVRHEPRGVA